MRKYIKQDILNIIETLKKAAGKLKALIQISDATLLQEFLTECQGAAISVGNTIEESEGEGTAVIPVLEEYCELLYQVLISGDAHTKELEDCLRRAEDEIVKLPERLEVVFLPYKASMWDSLESVWMAARDDENCDAYVVPIPYFDRNPDGSFGEMRCEEELYPEYVSVVSWQEYDFMKHRPDVAFIHNPYDEDNHVTSVHPFFYSKNLKQYVGKLVYIPYYVCSERTREENCVQKGVFYADKVVVQSETIKEEYIKYWTEITGRNIFEDKFLALGSPKFDKVIHCSELQSSILEYWKQIVGDRKVILYNTHLNTFLKHEEDAIKKLESVFDYFVMNKQVVLLWRPHPLTKATLKAMRPNLYDTYCKLEKRYIDDKIGIYDDNVDMYPAIAMADAYYGDSSSLINLFGVTGKPICIQQVDILDYKAPMQTFEGAYIEEDKIYYANADYNALIVFNKSTGEEKYLGEFPENSLQKRRITNNIAKWNDKLWMLPFAESRIFCYDLSYAEWTAIELPKPWIKNKSSGFFAGIQVEQFFYGFGCGQYGVVCLDLETSAVSFCRDNEETFNESVINNRFVGICRQDCCRVGDKLYVACLKCAVVLEYDTLSGKIQTYQVGDVKAHYSTICYDGTSFWLTTYEGEIIRWFKDTNVTSVISINLSDYGIIEGKVAFASSLYLNGYVWLFAASGNVNLRVNVDNLLLENVYTYNTLYNEQKPIRTLKSWTRDNKIYFMNGYDSTIVKISEDLEVSVIDIPVDSEFAQRVWRVENAESYMDYLHRENHSKNLDMYVKYILKQENFSKEQKKYFLQFTEAQDGNAGKRIYQEIIEGN